WKKSGTISTRPPMATTMRISTIMRKLLVSTFSCEKPAAAVLSLLMSCSLRGVRHGRHAHAHRAAVRHGHPGVPRHHDHAGEVQQAAEDADEVEGIARLDRF